jgi:hypothetical protein
MPIFQNLKTPKFETLPVPSISGKRYSTFIGNRDILKTEIY